MLAISVFAFMMCILLSKFLLQRLDNLSSRVDMNFQHKCIRMILAYGQNLEQCEIWDIGCLINQPVK